MKEFVPMDASDGVRIPEVTPIALDEFDKNVPPCGLVCIVKLEAFEHKSGMVEIVGV